MEYNQHYYKANAQDGDRPALWMYERIWLRYIGRGPVLEFGCGVGQFARRLSKHAKTYGLEINEYALQQIQHTAPNVQALRSTETLSDASVASVVALHVLEHIPDEALHDVALELNRVLQPGGRMLVVMPDLDGRAHSCKGADWSAFSDVTHVNLKGAKAWRALFVNQWGFHVVAAFADGYYNFPYGRSSPWSRMADALRAFRTMIQFLFARPVLKPGDGENIVFILEKQR